MNNQLIYFWIVVITGVVALASLGCYFLAFCLILCLPYVKDIVEDD